MIVAPLLAPVDHQALDLQGIEDGRARFTLPSKDIPDIDSGNAVSERPATL